MKPTETSSPERPDALRRKLFRGAYGGVGVMRAVQAKTALGGGVCQSPSAQMSGNTSPRPGQTVVCSGGRSPGFWKVPQHKTEWESAGAVFPTFKDGIDVCSGMGDLSAADLLTPGTLLTEYFVDAPGDVGMWQVLAFPDGVTSGTLLRHLTAAWLNSKYPWPERAYPLTPSQVQNMWQQLKSTGTYCPLGMTCEIGKHWSAKDVTDYIENMYDTNADTLDGPNLCKGKKS